MIVPALSRLSRRALAGPAAAGVPTGAAPTTGTDDPESGLVAVWFALLIGVFMGLAALGVDVGTFYVRAQDLQRSADAAALAAVAYMPDATKAETVATDTLRKNGIDLSKVTFVGSVGAQPRQYSVKLVDRDVPTFFGRILNRNSITIARSSLAEYTAPLPMGSAQNYLGWGGAALALAPGVPASAATPNYWLALNGYCVAKEQGDLLSARYDGNANTSTVPPAFTCGPESPVGTYWEDQSVIALPGQVPSYDAKGYFYSVKVTSGSTTVSIYDPSYCPDVAGALDRRLPIATTATQTVRLNYVLRRPDTAGTPNYYDDDPVVTQGSFSTCANALSWVDVGTVSTPGTYTLQVRTPALPDSLGANLFALRATSSGSTLLCDARVNVGCPQVSGLNAMSMMALVSGSAARFTFAEVPAGYAGKQIVMGLWDPGEGMTSMRIVDPAGTAVPFRVRVTPALTGNQPAFATTPQSSLDVSGCGTSYSQPGPNRTGNCLYNDRLVELLVDVPTTYSGGWWSVEYTGGTSPTDRTTWTVRVVGDPAHLTRG